MASSTTASPVLVCSSCNPTTYGVNAALCDGSVHFVQNGISLPAWRALSTAQRGEPVSADY